jgi:tRNA/tmRNA/rRNA uracil-C5-methylase (TrmA/RlmC/RlmD family)
MPSTTSTDDIADVAIHNIAFGGDGVATLADGMCVFVPFTAIGDEVKVRVVERHKRFARGKVLSYHKRADTHTKPMCPHFTHCGGCSYQHLNADEQVRLKVQQLQELLRRVGHLETLPEVSPIVRSPQAYGYRNKLTVHTGPGGVGFVARDNKTVIDIGNCPLASDPLNRKLGELRNDELKGQHLIMRHTGKERVTCGQPRERHRRWLEETLQGKTVRVPLGAFYQVNPAVAEQMMDWVVRAVREISPDYVLDLYCGCGVFALALAAHTKHVCGVDSDRESIAAARHNSRHWNAKNSAFIHGRLEEVIDEVLAAVPYSAQALAILDPPRTGCPGKVIDALLAARPKHLLYVSCNASTLARDLRTLCSGYEPVQLAYFDMFPQTAHFESAVLLKLKPQVGA